MNMPPAKTYSKLVSDVSHVIDIAKKQAVRSVNKILIASYWKMGRRIVEYEQEGHQRAVYGKALLNKLSKDLTHKYGRGFSLGNISQMRKFFLLWPDYLPNSDHKPFDEICWKNEPRLPWSAYVRLMTINSSNARSFYEKEAISNGWTVRQLDRQIATQFFERTELAKNKAFMPRAGSKTEQNDSVSIDEQIKDPYILEFLNLKDEYSESDLEEELIHHVEELLMEMGEGFTFVGRQRRIRIGSEWYRIDLIFYQRKLKCLVIVDIKVGKLSHADAGQMHMYLNYAAEHWALQGENPPIGLILCSDKDESLARYALSHLPNKVMASQYQVKLPKVKELESALRRTRYQLENPKK